MKLNNKHIYNLLIIFVMLTSSIYLYFNCFSNASCSINLPKNTLLIHYIDVGQGDATLIQINNKNLLIDSGPPNKLTLNYLKKLKIKTLDYVIATHPHDDHIGSMSCIIKNFKIHKFYAPKVTNNTVYFKKMLFELKNKNIKISPAKLGVKIPLDKNLNCLLVSPNNNHYDNINNFSAVLKITYKNNSFLFCGDAESESENEMLNSGYNINSDVLKVGHHGSKSSTTESFLNEINPKVAIISCGKKNDYGHPHKKVINNLKKKNINIYRTDLNGTIVLSSDGNKIIKK